LINDVGNRLEWAYYTAGYDRLGRQDYVSTVNDNGSRWVRDYDQDNSNVSGESVKTTSFNAAGDILRVYTVYDDGHVVDYQVDVSNSKPWATNSINFTPTGQVDNQTTRWDDGTMNFIDFDVGNRETYVRFTDTYNARGQLVSRIALNDDGSQTNFVNDADGMYEWASYSARFLANGQTDYVAATNDNGSRWVRDFDQDNTNAGGEAVRTNSFNASDTLIRSYVIYDDGHILDYVVDDQNLQSWQTNTLIFDTMGRLDTQTTKWDSGVTTYTDHDQASQFPYSRIVDTFDASGALMSRVTYFDDGSQTSIVNDTTNSNPWASYSSRTDSLGLLDYIAYQNDDGTRRVQDFDQDNTNPNGEAVRTILYDAQNQPVYTYVVYDDGHTFEGPWVVA
jgi:hypothetical protein